MLQALFHARAIVAVDNVAGKTRFEIINDHRRDPGLPGLFQKRPVDRPCQEQKPLHPFFRKLGLGIFTLQHRDQLHLIIRVPKSIDDPRNDPDKILPFEYFARKRGQESDLFTLRHEFAPSSVLGGRKIPMGFKEFLGKTAEGSG